MHKKLFVTIVMVSMALSTSTFSKESLGLMAFLRAASPQEKGRSVEKSWRKLAPLKIKTIKTKKGEILLGKTFVDNDDEWFQGLSVALENISGKTITYIGAGFLFPREGADVGKASPTIQIFSLWIAPGRA